MSTILVNIILSLDNFLKEPSHHSWHMKKEMMDDGKELLESSFPILQQVLRISFRGKR